MERAGESGRSNKTVGVKNTSELDKTKYEAIAALKNLCARCMDDMEHVCPVRQVTREIEAIRGIPVIVNSRLRHVVFKF